jgi:hypothetical protein
MMIYVIRRFHSKPLPGDFERNGDFSTTMLKNGTWWNVLLRAAQHM